VELLLPPAEELRQRRAEAEVQRTRRVYRWGLAVTLANLLCLLAALGATWILRAFWPPVAPTGMPVRHPVPDPIGLLIALNILLAVFPALSILVVLPLYALGRRSQALRQAGGAALVTLALVPWLLWSALLVLFAAVVLTRW
jgi:hypothetical protein